MAEKIKCDCGITFEVEEGQTHCNYCGIKLSDIGKEKPVGLAKEDKVTPGEKKKGRGCLILIGLLIGFFILIAAVSGGGKEKKPTPTPTPVKQEEVKPTPEVASEEMARFTEYYPKVISINTRVTEYMRKRGEIAGKWPNWTDEDVIKFAGTGVGLELAYDEAKELTPPKIMVSPHQKWLKALELFKQSVPIANKGIDNLNANLISQSADLMEEGTRWMKEATKEIEEITEKLKQ